MIIAVHQPQYLPWLGYFDKLDRTDIFVFLDDVQFKKNEWQNRNRIKTARGWQWLTVPVKYRYPMLIGEVEINNSSRWQHKHAQAIKANYARAPHYHYLDDLFEELFKRSWELISQLNQFVVRRLAEILGINTPIFVASELGDFPQDPDGRLIAITRHFGADTYLAGSGGREYMKTSKFAESGVELVFQDYVHPVYSQVFGEFEPYMSIIDLILNNGPNSLNILRGEE